MSKQKRKKRRTEWVFTALYHKGHCIRIGYIHNKKKGYPKDLIRLMIKGEEYYDLNMRADEASLIASGLAKVLGYMFLRGKAEVRDGKEKAL